MEILRTADYDELLVMQATLEAAAKARRKQNEQLAELLGHHVWKAMPKFK